jgi:hypothetical protein
MADTLDTLTPGLRQLLTLAHEDGDFRALLLSAPERALAAATDGRDPAFARWRGSAFTRVDLAPDDRARVLAALAAPAPDLRTLRARLSA